MKGRTLIDVVSEITGERVSEKKAKDYALNQFAVLCSHIRAELVRDLLDEKYQIKRSNKLKARKAENRKTYKTKKGPRDYETNR